MNLQESTWLQAQKELAANATNEKGEAISALLLDCGEAFPPEWN